MTQEELNQEIEGIQRRLAEYQLQLEIFSQREDLGEDDVAAEFDNVVRQIEALTDELSVLIEHL